MPHLCSFPLQFVPSACPDGRNTCNSHIQISVIRSVPHSSRSAFCPLHLFPVLHPSCPALFLCCIHLVYALSHNCLSYISSPVPHQFSCPPSVLLSHLSSPLPHQFSCCPAFSSPRSVLLFRLSSPVSLPPPVPDPEI